MIYFFRFTVKWTVLRKNVRYSFTTCSGSLLYGSADRHRILKNRETRFNIESPCLKKCRFRGRIKNLKVTDVGPKVYTINSCMV
jgi:hypothetical protein